MEFKSSEGHTTNTIEGSWRHLKRSVPINLRPGSYDEYVCEYLWRKKNRGKDLFVQFLNEISVAYAMVRDEEV